MKFFSKSEVPSEAPVETPKNEEAVTAESVVENVAQGASQERTQDEELDPSSREASPTRSAGSSLVSKKILPGVAALLMGALPLSTESSEPEYVWIDEKTEAKTDTTAKTKATEKTPVEKAKADKQTERKPEEKEAKNNTENEASLLKKINLEKDQIKPEFLKKYLEGKYKAIVIIDLKSQNISAYDSDGEIIAEDGIKIKDLEISSGRVGMETPVSSYESGKRERVHVNNHETDMHYAIPLDSKLGIFIHKGSLPGYPASHGCIRLTENVAKILFDLNEKVHDLVFVTR